MRARAKFRYSRPSLAHLVNQDELNSFLSFAYFLSYFGQIIPSEG